ncbi:hypothetical protein ACIGO9_31340 [Nocardia asteroides]|uniref:hypothetical protein n=1 Tax=Nocardia asteroides TaxID=1824 RepID=UPI0037C54228
MGDKDWEAIEAAMWARGWKTVSDRSTAWHLARGGVPVVLCDFGVNELEFDPIIVGRVRARVDENDQSGRDLPLISGGQFPASHATILTVEMRQVGTVRMCSTSTRSPSSSPNTCPTDAERRPRSS